MMAASKGAPPQFLSTHPSSETRIHDIEALLPRVEPIYAAAEKPPQRFGPPAPKAAASSASGCDRRRRASGQRAAALGCAHPPPEGTRPVAPAFPPAGRWCASEPARDHSSHRSRQEPAMNFMVPSPTRARPSLVRTPIHELALVAIIEDDGAQVDGGVQPLRLVRLQPRAGGRAASDRIRRGLARWPAVRSGAIARRAVAGRSWCRRRPWRVASGPSAADAVRRPRLRLIANRSRRPRALPTVQRIDEATATQGEPP